MAILRRLLLAGAASVVVTWAGRTEAKPAAVIELHWVGPARCPGADDVRARVRRLLGSDAAGPSTGERLIAEGTVVEVGGHYRLSLKVKQLDSEPAGVTRVLESTSCDSLAGAAAVTLVVLARGEASPSENPQPEAPQPATAQHEQPAPSRSETTSPSRGAARDQESTTPPTRWSPVLRAPVVISDAGVLPSAGYGIGLGAGVRVSQVLVMVSGVIWLSQDATSTSPYAATYQRRTGELSGCYSWAYGQFEGGPCVVMALEDVTADGSGAGVTDKQGHVSWLSAGVGVRAGFSFSRSVALFVRPTASFTTSRPTFAIDGVGPLYQVPVAAVGVGIGSEWIF